MISYDFLSATIKQQHSLADAEKHHRLGIVKVNFPSPLGSSVL